MRLGANTEMAIMTSMENEHSDDFGRGKSRTGDDSAWSFRGYQLEHGDFTTAMVHLFRAEINRANVWRQRLDATTNWAVISTGAAISIAFTEQFSSPIVIILNTLLITFFLYIEARRYRYYELWSLRVRLMETDFFSSMLVPPFRPAADWAESLAENLLHPEFPISIWEALGRRLRRNYFWMYIVMVAAWLLKVWLTPTAALSWGEMLQRASVGGLPGSAVLLAGIIFNSFVVVFAILTIGLQRASGEILPRFGNEDDVMHTGLKSGSAWFRPRRRRKQFMALIITDRLEGVSESILKEMHRGVTSMKGVGMYTTEPHNVLLCALTITEIPQLKALVKEADSNAFVIVSPAHDVLGKGFSSLKEE
jgi:uncharacterized membrane protein